MHAYAESLIDGRRDLFEKPEEGKEDDDVREAKGGADCVIICGGTLRGDSQYGPGKITLGDVLGAAEPMQSDLIARDYAI